MKISFPGVDLLGSSLSGKHQFCRRLSAALAESGHVVVSDDADVALHLVTLKKAKAKLHVLRLDGVYFDKRIDYVKRNVELANALKSADGVIYQSQYCCRLGNKYLGSAPCPVAVIFNGADPRYFQSAAPAPELSGQLAITFARWRPYKRLTDVVESFLMADLDDVKLVIAGNAKDSGISVRERLRYAEIPKLLWVGRVDEHKLASYLRRSFVALHLSGSEFCPNAIVESIAAGLPVICSNTGGAPELVEPSGGVICNLDREPDLKPIDASAPPPIDRRLVVDALISCLQPRVISSEHVDIRTIAAHYVAFFDRLLRGQK